MSEWAVLLLRDLENLKKENKKPLTILKTIVKTYTEKNLAAKEKESARMKKTSERDFLEKVANHAAQVKAVRDLQSKGKSRRIPSFMIRRKI